MSGVRPSINDIIGLGNFLTNFRWFVTFSSLGTLANDLKLDSLNVQCEGITFPKVGVPSVEVQIRGHKVKQSGIADYGNTITLTLVETTDMFIFSTIKKWRELTWQTKTGKTVNKQDMTTSVTITRLDNNDVPVWSVILHSCYLEDYDVGGDLDGSTADPTKPTMTLSFDYFEDGILDGASSNGLQSIP